MDTSEYNFLQIFFIIQFPFSVLFPFNVIQVYLKKNPLNRRVITTLPINIETSASEMTYLMV